MVICLYYGSACAQRARVRRGAHLVQNMAEAATATKEHRQVEFFKCSVLLWKARASLDVRQVR